MSTQRLKSEDSLRLAQAILQVLRVGNGLTREELRTKVHDHLYTDGALHPITDDQFNGHLKSLEMTRCVRAETEADEDCTLRYHLANEGRTQLMRFNGVRLRRVACELA